MAKYNAIKAAVNAYIRENGRKEITGKILNAVLNATIDSLGRFFQFAGGALPTDDPGTPDQNVCYLAGEPGVYTHFGNITIGNEEVALLLWDGEWKKQSITIGIQEVDASVDDQVGTPSVDVSYSEGSLVLTFHNMKGEPGENGAAAGFGTIDALIGEGPYPGPRVLVSTSGPNTAKNIEFDFVNIKGDKGDKGDKGEQGVPGLTSVIASVDNNSGIPFVTTQLNGQVLTISFHNLKGDQGNSGFSGAAEDLELVNNLTQGGVSAGLTAQMGVVLNNLYVLLRGMVGNATQSLDDLSVSWVQGTIDWDAGSNTASTVSLRSGFITIGDDHILRVTCQTGYFIKGVFAYNTASLSDYSGVLYRGNASGTMDTSKTYIEMPSYGKVLRVVVGRVDGATINVSEGSNITIQDYYEGLGGKTIVEHIISINGEIATLNSIPVGSIDIIPTVADTYVDSTGGLVGMTPTYVSTTLINVEEGDKFTYIGFAGSLALACAGYNTGGTFVQPLLGPGNYDNNQQEITIPSGINKVRFCGRIDTHPLDIKKISGTTKTAREAIIDLDNDVSTLNYFHGKKLYVLGDSIAYGSVASGTPPEKPFPVLVAEKLGMSLLNYGIGGSTIAVAAGNGGMFASLADLQAATKVSGMYYTVLTGNQTYQVYYWNGSTLSTSSRKLRNPLAQRYAFMADDADVVIVEAGTNDFQYNWTAIGTMADRADDSFYGALHVLCQGLLSKFFGKLIIFMTPIKRAQTQQDSSADTETFSERLLVTMRRLSRRSAGIIPSRSLTCILSPCSIHPCHPRHPCLIPGGLIHSRRDTISWQGT